MSLLERMRPSDQEVLQWLEHVPSKAFAKALADDPASLPALVRLSERLAPAARRRVLAALAQIKDTLDLERLAEAVLSNSVTSALAAAKVAEFPERFGGLAADLTAAFFVGAHYSLEQLARSEVSLSFELVQPHAVGYAERTLAQIVQPYQDDAKALIQAEVTRAMRGEQTPMDVARNIRDRIGLDPNRVARVDARYEQLLTEGYTDTQIDTKIGRFIQQLSTERAETIALTEVHRAAGAGQLDSWREAETQGLLDPTEWVRVWHTVAEDDGRVCDDCLAMDGVEIEGFGGTFEDADGNAVTNTFGETMEYADMHPRCRCVVRIEKR